MNKFGKIIPPKELNREIISNQNGVLGVVEFPFEVKRFYYLSKIIPTLERGHHAHKNLLQVFISLAGSFELELSTPNGKITYYLTECSPAVFVPQGYWRELRSFSPDAICGVFASEHFDESDYIRNFSEYETWFRRRYLN